MFFHAAYTPLPHEYTLTAGAHASRDLLATSAPAPAPMIMTAPVAAMAPASASGNHC